MARSRSMAHRVCRTVYTHAYTHVYIHAYEHLYRHINVSMHRPTHESIPISMRMCIHRSTASTRRTMHPFQATLQRTWSCCLCTIYRPTLAVYTGMRAAGSACTRQHSGSCQSFSTLFFLVQGVSFKKGIRLFLRQEQQKYALCPMLISGPSRA